MSGPIFELAFGHPPGPKPGLSEPEVAAAKLRDRYAALQVVHALAPGDLVAFKPGLDVRGPALRGQPMLVADLDLAGYPPVTATTAAPARRVDVVLWLLLAEGDILPFLADSRALEPWTPPDTAAIAAAAPAPEPPADAAEEAA